MSQGVDTRLCLPKTAWPPTSIEEPSIPASFRVLVKELQSLGLAVEAINEGGEVVRFGKDEEKQHPPKLDTGLLGIGNNLMTK